jgi:molecular chaperone DnaK
LSEAEIDRMRHEAEDHADEDKKRKELIEVRNHADNSIYTAEKTLKELGDKVPADVKKQTEESVNEVRQIMSGEDTEAIRNATERLNETIQKIGASMYQAPEQGTPGAPGAQGPGGGAGPEGNTETGPQGQGNAGAGGQQPGGEDVVDGEFKQV